MAFSLEASTVLISVHGCNIVRNAIRFSFSRAPANLRIDVGLLREICIVDTIYKRLKSRLCGMGEANDSATSLCRIPQICAHSTKHILRHVLLLVSKHLSIELTESRNIHRNSRVGSLKYRLRVNLPDAVFGVEPYAWNQGGRIRYAANFPRNADSQASSGAR